MAFSVSKYAAHTRKTIPVFFLMVWIMAGCGVKKGIPKGEYLLKKNIVTLSREKRTARENKIKSSDLSAQILHRSNKRVLFNKIPIYLWVYSLGTSHKNEEANSSQTWRKRMREDFGEPPILLDSGLTVLSSGNIANYLHNMGYFDACVNTEIKKTRRKAVVKYNVSIGNPYRINSFFREPADTALKPLLDSITHNSDFFRLWWPADLNKLNEAREFVAREMRNHGYYTVNQDYFYFELDTLKNKQEAAVYLKMDLPKNGRPFQQYTFGRPTLKIESSAIFLSNNYPDSVWVKDKLLIMGHYPFKAETMAKLIMIDSGMRYSQLAGENTYKSLSESGLFSYVDVRYEIDTANLIITPRILAKAFQRMNVSFEPQGLYSPQGTSGTNFQTQSQRSFGLAGILSFNNRNAFHHGESFRLSSVTSYEAIIRRNQSGNLLYGLQQGFNATLSLPHFSLLNGIDKLTKTQRRNTVLSVSYQFENNPNFKRSTLPASITFQFIRSRFSWYYTPLELSFNRNRLDPSFLPRLPALDQDFVRRVFTDQFISAAKLGLIYANNRTKPGETYLFTRAGLETSGNLHRWVRSLSKGFNADSSYSLLGVKYFQYAKMEGEIRLRQTLDELNTIAFRANLGVVLPYGNSNDVPYDKRYFIGGSNSLRAWRPRRLGPGTTPDTSLTLIDRSGEFLFETNFEYRFTVFPKFLEGALFFDAGNIWNLKREGQTQTTGTLNPATWGQELAMNAGIGFRFDFKFFLFRLDWGLPIRDPAKPEGKRWLLDKANFQGLDSYLLKESALAIGIGYPF
jgi:outer membrane translocation and assembly module TamA